MELPTHPRKKLSAGGKHAIQLCERAVQIHRGIGMTHELGHYFKRLTLLEMLYGSRNQKDKNGTSIATRSA